MLNGIILNLEVYFSIYLPGFPLQLSGLLISLKDERQSVRDHDHTALAVARSTTDTDLNTTLNTHFRGQSQTFINACAKKLRGIFNLRPFRFVAFAASAVADL